ncbi:glycine/D-amino acid oxidase-like deaminating enzyme [Arthrobacter sp. SLBN-112]|jgi:glycine/D-amino acid oxidase-like deaminating enzyme/nitrite reductase/ring-hydroxylating ferredoxin subunit|uniref:FAD-dependent oxidoreductase n=1 Tax=Arthrobacter sp. SLBN-112 TaxID=2768452 RepID=UPI00114DA793|nr:FAD-dependent oxidoreductase [Arthrobacter sp. SLBN-112]TQJ39655.1 glycine/D-amino acid oxidase-like deaminating enzyme [Arthrobacter sp. SLBN-112]
MTSIWLDRRDPFTSDPFEPDTRYDTVVAGAGLTGLVTALLLARSGQSVLVLEARFPGAVTTGNTTAKVTLLQGTFLSQLARQYSQKQVQAYVDGNREGQAWLLRYLEEHNVPFQRRDAYTYASSAQGTEKLREEVSAASTAGLDVDYVRDAGLPFPVHGAVRLRDQAQINPMEVIDALVADIRSRGGHIVSGVRLRDVTGDAPSAVKTDHGSVRADKVVLATGIPVLDRGLYFAKLKPSRSYAAALELQEDQAPPPGMYISVEQPTHSLRNYEMDGRNLLLVGGHGHQVGRTDSEKAHLSGLLEWAGGHYPGAVTTHTWSAQDYMPTNLMPFFGKLPRGKGQIYFGTGYNKWGMTNAVAAALGISADILGGQVPWADTIHHRITSPAGALSAVALNAGVAARLASGWGKVTTEGRKIDGLKRGAGGSAVPASEGAVPTPPVPAGSAAAAVPAEGQGKVYREGNRPVAVSTVAGTTCRLSAVCTHMGGILHWNDNEQSWDCPLHGSRFTNQGKLLEGPATRDLPEAPAG